MNPNNIFAKLYKIADDVRAKMTTEEITAAYRAQIEKANRRREKAEKDAAAEAELQAQYKTGRKSQGPFAEVYSRAIELPNWLQALYNKNFLQACRLTPMFRRTLTADEREMVAASSEVHAHGLLRCGEPAQVQLFMLYHIRVFQDDPQYFQMIEEVRNVAAMASLLVQRKNIASHIYLRFQFNIVVRAFRIFGRKAPRALYGGRLYVSDQPNHSGILLASFAKVPGATFGRTTWEQNPEEFGEPEEQAA